VTRAIFFGQLGLKFQRMLLLSNPEKVFFIFSLNASRAIFIFTVIKTRFGVGTKTLG